MSDEEIARLRARQERLAHPMIPWSIKDTEFWMLCGRGYYLVASGWRLHIESMS
jgi:hypothetical protein